MKLEGMFLKKVLHTTFYLIARELSASFHLVHLAGKVKAGSRLRFTFSEMSTLYNVSNPWPCSSVVLWELYFTSSLYAKRQLYWDGYNFKTDMIINILGRYLPWPWSFCWNQVAEVNVMNEICITRHHVLEIDQSDPPFLSFSNHASRPGIRMEIVTWSIHEGARFVMCLSTRKEWSHREESLILCLRYRGVFEVLAVLKALYNLIKGLVFHNGTQLWFIY